MSEHPVGSLALLPKRPRVWGDDQTTTRMQKAIAMAAGVDLSSPAAVSMRRYRRAAIWAYLALVALGAVVVALVVREAARWLAWDSVWRRYLR